MFPFSFVSNSSTTILKVIALTTVLMIPMEAVFAVQWAAVHFLWRDSSGAANLVSRCDPRCIQGLYYNLIARQSSGKAVEQITEKYENWDATYYGP